MSSPKKYSNGYWKVYVHTNKTNGKRYVGITSQKPEYRWNYGNAYQSNPYFTSAIQKYGWDGFEHEVLYDFLTEDKAKQKERELITLWNTQDREYGYNITAGGESTSGLVLSPEHIEKLRQYHTGRKRSEDTKRKLADAGKRHYAERRQILIEARNRPVNMYDLDGSFIRRFDSMCAAMAELGITSNHITDVCNGRRKSCAGYSWQYA